MSTEAIRHLWRRGVAVLVLAAGGCGPAVHSGADDTEQEAALREHWPGTYILDVYGLRARSIRLIEFRADGTAFSRGEFCAEGSGDPTQYEWVVTGPSTLEVRVTAETMSNYREIGAHLYTFEVDDDPCGPHQKRRYHGDPSSGVLVKGEYCLENPYGIPGEAICDIVPCDEDARACIDRIGPVTATSG